MDRKCLSLLFTQDAFKVSCKKDQFSLLIGSKQLKNILNQFIINNIKTKKSLFLREKQNHTPSLILPKNYPNRRRNKNNSIQNQNTPAPNSITNPL